MATVRITDELIKGMVYRLATVRRPEEDKLIAARPIQAMLDLYDYVMPEATIKLIEALPNRLRVPTIKTLHVTVPSSNVTSYVTEADIANETEVKMYAMSASSWQSEQHGPFAVSQHTITYTHSDMIPTIDESIIEPYNIILEHALAIHRYKADTTRMGKTLREFMTGQPSLNKAVAAMPSMHAFVPPEYKVKMAEVVERKKRTPAAPKPAADSAVNLNNVDAAALTELVMTAASTRV